VDQAFLMRECVWCVWVCVCVCVCVLWHEYTVPH
jgi:hypothetical protein